MAREGGGWGCDDDDDENRWIRIPPDYSAAVVRLGSVR